MYRTKTYVAGDWTGDKDAIDKLYQWNDSKYWSLSFSDAHEITQSRDSSLNCTIKRSLKMRMDASKTFVLIVGDKTNNLKAGGCQLCGSYNSWTLSCARGYYVDTRSYIKYECDEAINAGIRIVVLYNSPYVLKEKCPESVRDVGTHVAMTYIGNDGREYWDYEAVRDAIMGY